jgi:hypothetical protein
VASVIEGDAGAARALAEELPNYPLYITRDLDAARKWLRKCRRGNERIGLLASSNAARLKPYGIFTKAKIEPPKWFLAPSEDVRSSDALEDAATEFDVQGLELDWACLCWDGNYRRTGVSWEALQFKGTRWQLVNDVARNGLVTVWFRSLVSCYATLDSNDKGLMPPRYEWRLRAL